MTGINTTTQETADDQLLFASEESRTEEHLLSGENWKVMIVDDEHDVHSMTKLVLNDFHFDGKGLEFISAYSEKEAVECIKNNPDTALILLDVVMEDENTGLRLVHYIRKELENTYARIILRTGQPGQVPEKKVIIDYDINDFKEKSELTAQKLITTVIASLRAFKTIMALAELNDYLEEKVSARTRELHKANTSLVRSLEKLREDEEAGKKIQFKLLPEDNVVLNGFGFRRILRPSMYLSGDFVDYFTINDDCVGFFMADVAGHGVASAFVTVLIKSCISKHLDRYTHHGEDTILEPDKLLGKLNRELIRANLGKHSTAFYGVLRKSDNTLFFANAGQYPFPVLWQPQGTFTLQQKGAIVGLFDFSEYKKCELKLADKFELVLFSDGILDVLLAQKVADQIFALEALCNGEVATIEMFFEKVVHERGSRFPDDITVLVIQKGVEDNSGWTSTVRDQES